MLQDRDGPPPDPSSDLQTFFVLRVRDGLYALDVEHVQSVSAVVRPTRVPTAPPHIAGVVYQRGTLCPVIDLGRLLGLDARAAEGASEHGRLVVLVMQGHTLAIIADAVHGLFGAAPQGTRREEVAVDRGFRLGRFDHPAGVVTVLDGASMISHLLGASASAS